MPKIRPNGIANSKISRNFYFYLTQTLNKLPAEAGDNRPNATGLAIRPKVKRRRVDLQSAYPQMNSMTFAQSEGFDHF